MGPAVTLEKSSIGAKRYLPLPQVMPRLAQSARRHSGSTSGYQTVEGNLKKPHVMRNLKRQWSSDCVLGRGELGISLEDGSSFFGDISEIRHCPLVLPKDICGCTSKPQVLSCKDFQKEGFMSCRVECSTAFKLTEQAEGITTCTTNKFHPETNISSPVSEAGRTATGTMVNRRHQSGRSSRTFREDESTMSATVRPVASNLPYTAGNTILDLEANNNKLMQRVSALMRRVKHLYKKGIHLNLEKYHQQLQMALTREGMTLKSPMQPASRLSEKIDSRSSESSSSLNLSSINLEELKSIGEDSFSSRSFDRKDSSLLCRNIPDFVRKLEKSFDPDATEESSSDRELNPESHRECDLGNVDEKSLPEQEWIIDRVGLSSRWRRLDLKLRLVDEEARTAELGLRKLRRHKTRKKGEVGRWSVRTRPDSLKLVFSRSTASRCVPFDWSKRRKRISMDGRTADSSDRCASHGYPSSLAPDQNIDEDPYKLSQVIWKRWSSASVDRDGLPPRASESSDLPNLSCDYPTSDFGPENVFHESKSVARVQNLLGSRSRRDAAKSSTARTGSETGRKSGYDINDVILLPTNSSSTRLDTFVRKKDIDVPTWRYVACNQLDQESESEDTSDSAYVRRHLEPEITERRHRVPEFISKGRRREHSKGPFSNLAGRRRNFRRQTVRSSFDCDVFTEASKFGRPDCHGDGGYGKREPSEAFEWSSISHHSDDTSVFHVDDKSLDGASWISATNACTSSDISADSALPRGELVGGVYRVKWTTCGEGDRPERSGTSIESCSTASACSPLNSDLQL